MIEEDKRFIQENINSDVRKLLLNPPREFRENIQWLVEQIQSRQKAKDKLPTWFSNPDLLFPPPLSVEQCSSEATATYKSALISGKQLIDLTGGMGVDTLVFADHFEHVIYVEQSTVLCERMAHNASVFKKEITVVNGTAEEYLATTAFGQSTTFFIDPARRDATDKKVFRLADCTPNLIELKERFRAVGANVLVKAAPLIDLSMGIEELESVAEIHVVSVKNDCKEVLFLLDFQKTTSPIPIRTVNITVEEVERFDFTFEDENELVVGYGDARGYLLIPNASILKAGAFKSIAKRFDITKISANTHFYTCDTLVQNFPGRQFEILSEPISKKLGHANVISRNHPLTPQQILKKFKLKEGGDQYILAYRDKDEKPQMVLARKV